MSDKSLIAEMNDALEREQTLLSVVTGETVSKLIADFICGRYQELAQNNRSTYPDLFPQAANYSSLPKRTRGLAEGPALRGGRPTSVPDGIEIKSNRGRRIRVDCHHDHQGLHLALTFDYDGTRWRVYDVYLAYLSKPITRARSGTQRLRQTSSHSVMHHSSQLPQDRLNKGCSKKQQIEKARL